MAVPDRMTVGNRNDEGMARHASSGVRKAGRSPRSSRWFDGGQCPGTRGPACVGSGRRRGALRLRAGGRGSLGRPGPGGAGRDGRCHELARQDRQDLDGEGAQCGRRADHRLRSDAVPLHAGPDRDGDVHRRVRQNMAAASDVERRARVGTAGSQGPVADQRRQRSLAGRVPQGGAVPLRRRQEEGSGSRAGRGRQVLRRAEERHPRRHGHRWCALDDLAHGTPGHDDADDGPALDHGREHDDTHADPGHAGAADLTASRRRRHHRRPRRRRPPPRRPRPRPPPPLAEARGSRSRVRWPRCRPWAR